MTCDITYHPLSEIEMKQYALFLDDSDHAARACEVAGLDSTHTEHFLGLLPRFREPADGPFELNHGYHIALTQGFFGTYFYTRGSRLSAVGPSLGTYTTPWADALPELETTASAGNQLAGSYSSGVYLSPENVVTLMADYQRNPELANAVQAQFPSVNLNILWAALTHASELSLGLLEACGAIEPNPLDLPASRSFTTFANCDPTGLGYYVQAAQAAAQAQAAAHAQPPPPSAQPPPPQAAPTQPGQRPLTHVAPQLPSDSEHRPSSGLAARLQELREQQQPGDGGDVGVAVTAE